MGQSPKALALQSPAFCHPAQETESVRGNKHLATQSTTGVSVQQFVQQAPVIKSKEASPIFLGGASLLRSVWRQ